MPPDKCPSQDTLGSTYMDQGSIFQTLLPYKNATTKEIAINGMCLRKRPLKKRKNDKL